LFFNFGFLCGLLSLIRVPVISSSGMVDSSIEDGTDSLRYKSSFLEWGFRSHFRKDSKMAVINFARTLVDQKNNTLLPQNSNF